MTEREFTGPDGRIWLVRERPEARREDGLLHVTLDLETAGERRVATCSRTEWEVPDPNFVALLARSVPGGASRGLGAPEPPPAQEPREADGLAW
jgi:hypothetical protein